jgi:hypothetical protein
VPGFFGGSALCFSADRAWLDTQFILITLPLSYGPRGLKNKDNTMNDTEKKDTTPVVEEVLDTGFRADFDGVNSVYDALFNAFHPDGLEEDETLNFHMISLWNLFLATTGWTEDEFWSAFDAHCEGVCPDCGEPYEEHGKETETKELN